MRRRAGLVIASIAGIFVLYLVNTTIGLAYTFNSYNEALAHLTRVESAQTPDEVINEVKFAKALLPQNGKVFWWSEEILIFNR